MSTYKLVLRKNKPNSMGECPILIRVTHERKSNFISTGKRVLPKDWDDKQSKVKKSHVNSSLLNNYLINRLDVVQRKELELESEGKVVTAKRIKNELINKAPVDFFAYADEYLNRFESTGKIGMYSRVKTVLNKLEAYLGKRKVDFKEIDFQFIKEYEKYLISEMKNTPNTVVANLKVLKKVMNDAQREKLIKYEQNPFNEKKFQIEKVERTHLTIEEIESIRSLDLRESTKMALHRDVFLFCIEVGGIRVSDVCNLKWSNFDGSFISTYTIKTTTAIRVKISERAKGIMHKYKTVDSTNDSYIFPLMLEFDEKSPTAMKKAIGSATAYYNKNLKEIGKKAKLSKRITSHVARHSFATIALTKGVGIATVSKLMGHASIKETQIYAKVVDVELERAMDLINS